LTESEEPAVRKPGLLTSKSIEHTFGNVETLREEMLETADAMFGNGFVWLMKGRGVSDLKLLATYNAGSPFPGAAPRRQNMDMATSSLADQLTGNRLPRREQEIQPGPMTAGHMGNSKHYEGLLQMQPVLCLNVWEHQWIKDYGLLGKKSYLANWWDRIDWAKVEILHATEETENEYPSSYNSSRGRYGDQSSVLDAVQGIRRGSYA